MAKIQPAELAKKLASDKFKREPFYLLYGSEPRRIQEAANRLRSIFTNEVGEENFFRYVGAGAGQDDMSSAEIVGQLNTMSMFGGSKVVWVGPIVKIDKETAKTFEEYARNPNPSSTLILSVVTGKGNAKAITAFEKTELLKAVVEKCVAVRFSAPRGEEIYKWVEGRFRRRGLSANRQAIELLVDLCDRDLDRLDGEVEKLSSYAGDEIEVTLAMVEETVGDNRTAQVWDLTRAIRKRDINMAMATLDTLMEHNTPARMILKSITKELALLSTAHSFKCEGGTYETFKSAVGGYDFILTDIWRMAERWEASFFIDGQRALLEASMNVMRSAVSPESILCSLVARLLAKNKTVAAS
ncbi:hypothetical protein MNBD_NITROSPINAE01-335 [hydrothermal vent metagenome]|uniref:DNA polymerase III subunit delta n=1 Tax=hydrothermal vent metagenome TaxID=652676 RepID=A0A3B1CF91_9ZZZZ